MTYAEAVDAPGRPASDDSRPTAREIRARWRRQLLTGFGLCLLAAAIAGGVRWYFENANIVSTDDAYVDAPLAEITPQIDGTIGAVNVNDAQYVKRGQVLVALDQADSRLALEQARAGYEQAVRHVRQYVANADAAAASVQGKESNLKRAELALRRRANISRTGAVSGEEISNANNAFDEAKADLAMARQQLAAQRALIQDADITQNPEVLAAKTALDKAQLDLERTQLRAPIDGIVAERHAQIGQRVHLGATLMTIVPVMEAHVDANFKEVQLERIRPGQPVSLTSDLYGNDVVYHGHVAGVGGGTGAAFAVIPAQNATGNWIKVVQRLPVRIILDRNELVHHPLRIGLSMTAKINLAQADTPPAPLLRAAASSAAY